MKQIDPVPALEDDKLDFACGIIHASKGLEFNTAIIVGCHEGHFPSHRSHIEEERRLAYVGMTRAKTRLLLMYCEETEKERSRFLGEIDF